MTSLEVDVVNCKLQLERSFYSITPGELKMKILRPRNKIISLQMPKHKKRKRKTQDWHEKGLIAIQKHKTIGEGVFAVDDLVIEFKEGEKVGDVQTRIGSFEEQVLLGSNGKGSRKEVEYIVAAGDNFYDLKPIWVGKLNHAPPGKLCNVYATASCEIMQIQTILKGEELKWDYGAEFWIFQLTGFDPEEFNASSLKIFRRMHRRVVDYTELIKMRLFACLDKDEMVQAVQHYLTEVHPGKGLIY